MTDISRIIELMGDKPVPTLMGSALTASTFLGELLGFIGGIERTPDPDEPPRTLLRASGLNTVCGRREMIIGLNPTLGVAEKKLVGHQLTYDVGTATHSWWQNKYLGPWQRLWGHWFCSKCGAVTFTGLMPHKCPDCGKGRTYWATWEDEDGNAQTGKVDNIIYVEKALIDEELGYTGHPDGVLVDPAIGGAPQMLFELKTISPSGYEKLGNKPKTDHVIQMHAYMRLLKMREGLLVYTDKGKQADWRNVGGRLTPSNPHIKVFHIEFDDDFWAKIETRIKDHYRAVEMLNDDDIEVTMLDVATFPRVCAKPSDFLAKDCGACLTCFSLRVPK